MNNSFPRLIDGMCATLRNEVLPRLEDEFARGQVFGVINLLNTFRTRADWSTGFLFDQVQAQCEALKQAAQHLGAIAHAPQPAIPEVLKPVSPMLLLELRDRCNQQIGDVMAWCEAHRDALPPGIGLSIEAALRQAMRREIEIELKNSPRPLFSEMSSGKEDAAS